MDTPLPSELQALLLSIRASLDHLENGIIPSISSSTTSDTFDTHTSAGRDEFAFLDRKLDDAELLGDECEDDSQCAQALDKIREMRQRSARLRTRLRTTSLEVKRKMTSSSLAASRLELLKSNPASKPARLKSSNPDETLMSASTDVAESLKSTLNIMRQELDRSVLSTQILEQQTKTLSLTSNQYTTFGDLLTTSRALVTSIQRADILDRLILGAALLFFVLVCLYILKKRILDRGLSLLGTVSRIKPALAKSGSKSQPAPGVIAEKLTEIIYDNIALATATSLAILPLVTSKSKLPEARQPEPPQPDDALAQPVNPAGSVDSLISAELNLEIDIPSVDEHDQPGAGNQLQASVPDHETPTNSLKSPTCSARSDETVSSACSSQEDASSMCSIDSDTDASSTCSAEFKYDEATLSNSLEGMLSSDINEEDDPLADHDEL